MTDGGAKQDLCQAGCVGVIFKARGEIDFLFHALGEVDVHPTGQIRWINHHSGAGIQRTGSADAHSHDVIRPPGLFDETFDDRHYLSETLFKPFIGFGWKRDGFCKSSLFVDQAPCDLCSTYVNSDDHLVHGSEAPIIFDSLNLRSAACAAPLYNIPPQGTQR